MKEVTKKILKEKGVNLLKGLFNNRVIGEYSVLSYTDWMSGKRIIYDGKELTYLDLILNENNEIIMNLYNGAEYGATEINEENKVASIKIGKIELGE